MPLTERLVRKEFHEVKKKLNAVWPGWEGEPWKSSLGWTWDLRRGLIVITPWYPPATPAEFYCRVTEDLDTFNVDTRHEGLFTERHFDPVEAVRETLVKLESWTIEEQNRWAKLVSLLRVEFNWKETEPCPKKSKKNLPPTTETSTSRSRGRRTRG